MAFFKFRKAGGEQQAPAPAPESVEAMRKRARYRLAGAAMLVLAGVIGFPLLFDNQPRPIAVDIPIEIPDKAKVKPLTEAGTAAEPKAAEVQASAAVEKVQAAAETSSAPASEARSVSGSVASAVVKDAKPANKDTKVADKEEVIISTSKPAAAKAEEKPAPKAEHKADAKPADKPKETAKDKPDATGRFVVQFGAFTDSTRAHEARLKVEKLGMKTYAQIAEGPEGKKFRVRVGPFEKRSDAEKAAEKIKKLDLPAAILGL